MRYLFLLAILFHTPRYCNAQFTMKSELTIGDTMQDVEINNIVNGKKGSVKVSDFKGKLLILDFWATWCSPCIKVMPKLDSLQKYFGSKIQILPVTYEDSET